MASEDECTGSLEPVARCGYHHKTELADAFGGNLCCCGAPWLTDPGILEAVADSALEMCADRGEAGEPVELRERVRAALGFAYAKWPGDTLAAADYVMRIVDPEIDGVLADLSEALNHNEATCEAVRERDEAQAALERAICFAEGLADMAPSDDWGENVADTLRSDEGRAFLRILKGVSDRGMEAG